MDGMVRIPGATFLMGSDRHYPEEAPAHKVMVDGFWINAGPVTNREFGRFVRKTGYVTVAERAPTRPIIPRPGRNCWSRSHRCSSRRSTRSA